MNDTEYIGTATYSPDDNKLRLYPLHRLDTATYERVKAAGYKWAPKQELFVAPTWNLERVDLATELCGEIEDEDKSLVERSAERAERMETYSEKRAIDAERAQVSVSAIADNIPLGQPILVGHHSARHARRDAEKIENGMRRAVKMWEQSQYWKDRAAGAVRAAKYKERPDVRARRIKGIEKDQRATERTKRTAMECLKFWRGEMMLKAGGKAEVTHNRALSFCNQYDHLSFAFPLAQYPRPANTSQYEGLQSLWGALGGSGGEAAAIITVDQARDLATQTHERMVARCDRWLEHFAHRLEYERAMLATNGGTVTDRTGPEVGGACRCWASPGYGKAWAYMQKVNRVSVTILDNWGNGGENFTRIINFDKLAAVMTRAEVDAARAAGTLWETDGGRGFVLAGSTGPDKSVAPEPEAEPPSKNEQAKIFAAMKDALREGVKVITAPQLFPTPSMIAAKMVDAADIQDGQRILEPSAGTGNLLEAIEKTGKAVELVAVEINLALADHLRARFAKVAVQCCDFLKQNGNFGKFDRILMNPPFERGADIEHIRHALTMLKPDGRLVALCANGSRQQDALQNLVDTWEPLPEGSFQQAGTGVNVVMLTSGTEDRT